MDDGHQVILKAKNSFMMTKYVEDWFEKKKDNFCKNYNNMKKDILID